MDSGTLLGFVVGCTFIVVAVTLSGGLVEFLNVPGLVVTVGGASASLFVVFPARQVLCVPVIRQCCLTIVPDARQEMRRFVRLAAVRQREGQPGIERKLNNVLDPFLIRGLEMVIDGMPGERVEAVLRAELKSIQQRYVMGKKMVELFGSGLPIFGLVGTLMGLIQMLSSLQDPVTMVARITSAMTTIFYGSFAANLIAFPLAGQLHDRSKRETHVREIMIQGLVCLAAGEGPRVMESRLQAFSVYPTRRDGAPVSHLATGTS